MQNEKKSVQAEFNQVRVFLDSEEQKELLKLNKEEADILHHLAEAENELVQQKQLVSALISDLEHRLQGSTMEMLQVRLGKKSHHLRYEKMKTSFLLLWIAVFFLTVTLRFLWSCSTFPETISEVIGIIEWISNKGKSQFLLTYQVQCKNLTFERKFSFFSSDTL